LPGKKPQYKELMAVAVALTTQCRYCIEIHKEEALKAGATEAELAETTFVAAALRAGAAITHGTYHAGTRAACRSRNLRQCV
jgi:AhpD family alkylhydroperoxidase